MFQFAAGLFSVVAIAYLVQLWRLIRLLREDHPLWTRLGEPSLLTWSGQRSFDRILYRPGQLGIDKASILRQIRRTKWLQIAGIACFLLAAAIFVVNGRPDAPNNSFKPTPLRGAA